MNRVTTARLFAGLLVLAAAPTQGAFPTHRWSQNLEAAGFTGAATGFSIATDASGSVVVAALVALAPSSSDARFACWKYDGNGSLRWSQTWPGARTYSALAVRTDAIGNVLLTGSFFGTADFGGGPLVEAGAGDIFFVTLDGSGGHVSSRRFGGAGADAGLAIHVDSQGRVFLAGLQRGGVDFGGGVLNATGSVFSYFLAEFDANGVHQSSRAFGAVSGAGSTRDMAVSDGGAVCVAGDFRNTVDFGSTVLTSVGQDDILFLNYDGNGTPRALRGYGSSRQDRAWSVAVDAGGDVFLAGQVSGAVNFGGSTTNGCRSTFFVACFDANGVHRWDRADLDGCFATSAAFAVAVHPSGGAVVAGALSATGTTTLDAGTGPLRCSGSSDFFVARYDAGGNALWAGRTGDASYQIGDAVAVDTGGNAVVAGVNTGRMFFCTGTLAATPITHGFLAKYSPVLYPQGGPPTAPTNASYDGDVVQWSVSTDADGSPVSYHIYQSTGAFPGGTVARAEGTNAPVAAFDNFNNFIYITAIDCVDNESAPTPRIEIHPTWTHPLAPTELTHSGTMLSWTPPTDPDVVHYVVHGARHDSWTDPSRTRLGLTTATSFDVAGARNLFYFVTAVDASLGWGDHASVRDTAVPVPPTGFAYVIHRLVWDESSDPLFANFKIYAALNGDFASGAKIRIGTTTNLGMHVPPEFRFSFYHITQTDVTGRTSAPVTIAGLDDSPPAPPGTVTLTSSYLTWGASGAFDLDHYTVYGSDSDVRNKHAVRLGTTYNAFMSVLARPYRYYFVTASDVVGNESEDRRALGIDVKPSRPTGVRYQRGVLSWTAPPDTDLDHFAVYGSNSGTFGTGSKRIADTEETSFDVTDSDYRYYFVVAVDVAGQESEPARITVPTFKLSLDVRPNPARDQASIAFALPSSGRARVRIFDVRGVWIATVFDADRDLGEYTAPWDGRLESGAIAPAGVYFARLEFRGGVKTRKLVLLR